jgi:aryl-alcohol dehydrogenase-like predicted oxidoreductase
MEVVALGKSGIKSSVLAMGADLLSSKIDKETTFSLLDCFFENGGTLVDTASFYASWLPGCSRGESETAIGAWMKERGNRDKIALSSKLSLDYAGANGFSKSRIASECEKSLKRLQTDRLDICYAYNDGLNTPQEEIMSAFDALVRAGKVRVLGAGNLPVWRIAEANTIARANGYATFQLIQQFYTYLRPRLGVELEPRIFLSDHTKEFAQAYGIGLLASSALLFGAYARANQSMPLQFAGIDSDERLAVLNYVSAEVGYSREQVILAWMRQSSPAVVPIISANRSDQLKENMDALNLTLTDEQMQHLTTAGNVSLAETWLQSK